VRRRVWRGSRAIRSAWYDIGFGNLHCRDFSIRQSRCANRVSTAWSAALSIGYDSLLVEEGRCLLQIVERVEKTLLQTSRKSEKVVRKLATLETVPITAWSKRLSKPIVPSIAKPCCADCSRTSDSRAGGRVRAEGHSPSLGAYNLPCCAVASTY
jgi:hypothetical protein